MLALVTVGMLFIPSDGDKWRWAAFILTALIIWGDGIDGYFARKLNQTTKFGAMFDIAGDRVVEMAYWITFAVLNWVPMWVPLLYLVRGSFVDMIRAAANELGFTAFGDKTMMRESVGRFLVASNFSRFTYAMVKAFSFCLLIAAHTSAFSASVLPTVAMGLVYLSCFFCLVRGLPVFFEARGLFK